MKREHKNLIIKFLEELHFEEFFDFQYNEELNQYVEPITGLTFRAHRNLFDGLIIDEDSLSLAGELKNINFYEFFDFIRDKMNMSPDDEAMFLTEAQNTLIADSYINDNVFQGDMLQLDFHHLDSMGEGHPKLILNKGRIGFSISDMRLYAPESHHSFALVMADIDQSLVLADNESLNIYRKLWPSRDDDKIRFLFHPWQWEQIISLRFYEEIKSGKIKYYGKTKELFYPLSSIRTLSSLDLDYEIKTSLSILNTSCYRGIPKKHILTGHHYAKKLKAIIEEDDFLKKSHIEVLTEFAGLALKSPLFDDDKNNDMPYLYQEYGGLILRDKPPSKNTLSISCLWIKDHSHQHLISSLIKRSHLSIGDWLIQYTKVVILPLFHLQIHHGVGLVSHGQNLILNHRDGVPYKLYIKDFHGDLRLSENSKHVHSIEFKNLDRLPENYLIYDLITGHFVTCLRYLYKALYKDYELKLDDFVRPISLTLKEYEKEFGHFSLSLLAKEFERVLVNRVRFQVGYKLDTQRPKPMLGNKMKNDFSEMNHV